MTARITPQQIDRIRQLLGEVLEDIPLSRDVVVQERLIGQGDVLKARFRAMILAMATGYFVLLSDEEAYEWLRKRAGKDEAEAKRIVSGYRRGAKEHKISDSEPCHVFVSPEATMKGTD